MLKKRLFSEDSHYPFFGMHCICMCFERRCMPMRLRRRLRILYSVYLGVYLSHFASGLLIDQSQILEPRQWHRTVKPLICGVQPCQPKKRGYRTNPAYQHSTARCNTITLTITTTTTTKKSLNPSWFRVFVYHISNTRITVLFTLLPESANRANKPGYGGDLQHLVFTPLVRIDKRCIRFMHAVKLPQLI